MNEKRKPTSALVGAATDNLKTYNPLRPMIPTETNFKYSELLAFSQKFLEEAKKNANNYADRRLRTVIYALKDLHRQGRIPRRTAIEVMINFLRLKKGEGGLCRIVLLQEILNS